MVMIAKRTKKDSKKAQTTDAENNFLRFNSHLLIGRIIFPEFPAAGRGLKKAFPRFFSPTPQRDVVSLTTGPATRIKTQHGKLLALFVSLLPLCKTHFLLAAY